MQYEDARTIALQHIQNLSEKSDMELHILESSTVQDSFGWVFFYTSKRFKETGSIRDAIAGNSPFIVDMDTGEIHTIGTAYPVQHYIDEYRRKKE